MIYYDVTTYHAHMTGTFAKVRDVDLIPEDRSLNSTAVLVGAGIGILIQLIALATPLLVIGGGGLMAGFIAAYIVGGPRGWFHGAAAGLVTGVINGFIVALPIALIGMVMGPPTLISVISDQSEFVPGLYDLITTGFTGVGTTPFDLLFIIAITALFLTAEALVGGLLGGGLRSLVDRTFR